MFGAKISLIVLTSQRLARIDLSGPRRGLRVERIWDCPAIGSQELAASIAIAYRLGETSTRRPILRTIKSPTRSLVVLCDDIWNDTISLPLDVTVLLSPEELVQAIRTEASNYSGINAFQSRIASLRLLDTSSNLVDTSSNPASTPPQSTEPGIWWVAQIGQTDLDAISLGAKACGARLLGATHPLACNQGIQGRTSELTEWTTPASLAQLGQRWAELLSQGNCELLVQAGAHPVESNRTTWLQTGVALATALACTGIYQLRCRELSRIESNIASQQKQLSLQEATVAKLQAFTATASKTQSTTNNAPQPNAMVTAKRPQRSAQAENDRWLRLLEGLSQHVPDECWIESWQQQDGQIVLSGRALSVRVVHDTARRLELALKPAGWHTQPPQTEQDSQELVRFELPLTFHDVLVEEWQ